jgi:pimeloyl-ACP methyl ester carboxylesterase
MPDLTAKAAFLRSDAEVFSGHSLETNSRSLHLKPGMTIRAVEAGTGEPVLFLHGFSLCTSHWAPLFTRLESVRRIAIDMPGHGASDGFDYAASDLRRWFREMLTACLDELGVESAHIVGHSQGAMLGMWLALDAPERVRSLIMIGTPAVALGARLPELRVLARPGIGSLLLSMPKLSFMYRRILANTIGRQAVESASKPLIRATYLATRNHDFGRTVSSYIREMFAGADAEPPRYILTDDELGRITQPVLVLWGEGDHNQPRVEAETRVGIIPHACFSLVPGGHEPWLDNLDACAERIAAFLPLGALRR